MDKKRLQISKTPSRSNASSFRRNLAPNPAEDQPAVDELCKILARILRRMNENDSLPSVID